MTALDLVWEDIATERDRFKSAVLAERERCAAIVENRSIREDRSLMNQFSAAGEISDSLRVNLAAKIRSGQ